MIIFILSSVPTTFPVSVLVLSCSAPSVDTPTPRGPGRKKCWNCTWIHFFSRWTLPALSKTWNCSFFQACVVILGGKALKEKSNIGRKIPFSAFIMEWDNVKKWVSPLILLQTRVCSTNPAWKLFPCVKSLTLLIFEVNPHHSFPWISDPFFLPCSWRSIIDHLLTHEKTMFKDLMSKYQLLIIYFYHNLKSILHLSHLGAFLFH